MSRIDQKDNEHHEKGWIVPRYVSVMGSSSKRIVHPVCLLAAGNVVSASRRRDYGCKRKAKKRLEL